MYEKQDTSFRGGFLSAFCIAWVIGSALLFFLLAAPGEVAAHGDHGGAFNPPMKPPPFRPGNGKGGGKGNGKGNRAAIARTGKGPAPIRGPGGAITPPSTCRGAGTGGLAKKTRGAFTTTVSWEHWWGRNRFLHLDFPGLEGHLKRRPFSAD